jgi:hypothetical protein
MLAETLVSKNQSMASKGTPTAIAFWFNIQWDSNFLGSMWKAVVEK